MKFWLVIYLLSTGIYFEPHSTEEGCNDALIEARLVKGNDLWSGMCVDPSDGPTELVRREVEP